MDGRGDGLHNGRNRQNLHLLLFPRGDRPPADQLNAGVIAWMEFLINQGFDDFDFMIIQPEHQLDNDNQRNDNNADEDEDNNNDNVNDDNDNDIVNNHNDNNDHEVNNDSNGVRGNDSVNNDVDDTDSLPRVSRKRSREEDEERDEESKRFRWWDEFAESSTDSDTDNDDCDYNDTIKNTDVPAECPLPGPSRKRSREHDEEDDRSCKKARQLGDRDSDSARTGQHHALSSHSSYLAQGPGATEETDEDVNQEVEEEDRQPRKCKKKSRL